MISENMKIIIKTIAIVLLKKYNTMIGMSER